MLQNATRVLNTDGVAVPLGPDQRAELEATITQVQAFPDHPCCSHRAPASKCIMQRPHVVKLDTSSSC